MKGVGKLEDSCFESKIALDLNEAHNCICEVRCKNNTILLELSKDMGVLTAEPENFYLSHMLLCAVFRAAAFLAPIAIAPENTLPFGWNGHLRR